MAALTTAELPGSAEGTGGSRHSHPDCIGGILLSAVAEREHELAIRAGHEFAVAALSFTRQYGAYQNVAFKAAVWHLRATAWGRLLTSAGGRRTDADWRPAVDRPRDEFRPERQLYEAVRSLAFGGAPYTAPP